MSWIQNLYDTYIACESVVGLSSEGQGKMLLPMGHILMKTDVVVHLRADGTFRAAEKNEADVCAPCTDDSESRAGTSAADFPHPLFDQIKHIKSKHYLDNLSKWRDYLAGKAEHATAYAALTSVQMYMQRGSLKEDLLSCAIESKDAFRVRFCVEMSGLKEDRLWMMPEMWCAWNSYYQAENINKRESGVCYITGNLLPFTEKNPKSINRDLGNAKLISGNDKSNFTYRGRYTEPTQAVVVGYETSQKVHQALRWLIATRGYRCGSQAIIAWAIDKYTSVPSFYDDSYGIYESEMQADAEKLAEAGNITFIDYAKWLNTAFLSSGKADRLKTHMRRVAVMATDVATTGRMAVTYYRVLTENEYLERVSQWHNTCKWFQLFTREKGNTPGARYFIGAPSVDRIIEAYLGKKRKGKDESYDKLKKAARERILHCIMDGERIPADLLNAAIQRASNPLALENNKAKTANERWYEWEQILCTSCALSKRYYHDCKKEEYELILEESRTDRDYLYGRLLAIADAIESSARYKQNKTKTDERATNAIRYMTAFSQHPFRTWNILWNQLNPYIQQLNGANWYMNQIGEIKVLFSTGEYESDNALDGRYLMGFFAQRYKLRNKNTNSIDGGKDNEFDEQN